MKPLPLAPVEILIGCVALQRLFELGLSHRNLRALPDGSRDADSSANWAALVAAQTLWLGGSALEPALRGRAALALVGWSGLLLFVLGQALRMWCMHTLGVRWNARARVDPALRVESAGPYRWIRHPNYLAVLLEVIGLPLAAGAWITLGLALAAHALVLRARIRGEDELLFAVPGYAAAMGGKGALLPRLFARANTGERP